MTGQTTLEQTNTVLLTSQILLQATKARLRYKCVNFHGTANHIAMADMVILIAPDSTYHVYHSDVSI